MAKLPAAEQGGARNRARRKLPDFMYGDNFPVDRVGAGGATYGGAVDWLTKHRDDFETAMRYIQRYPNIVQEPCLDNFWDFLEPLVYNNALLLRYDQFLRTQFGYTENFRFGSAPGSPGAALPTAAQFFAAASPADTSGGGGGSYDYPLRRVFFCCPLAPALAPLRSAVLDALLPLCSVRTAGGGSGSGRGRGGSSCRPPLDALDVCRSLSGGAWLVLALCDAALADDECMHALRIAVAYGTPVVAVREAGYELPAAGASLLPSDAVELVRPPADAPFVPQRGGLAVNDARRSRAAAAPAAAVAKETIELADVLRRAFAESVVYNPKMSDASIALLLERLAPLLGQPQAIGSSAAAAAASVEQPVRVGSASAPRKPLHRIGSARTTVTFEQSHTAAAPAGTSASDVESTETRGGGE